MRNQNPRFKILPKTEREEWPSRLASKRDEINGLQQSVLGGGRGGERESVKESYAMADLSEESEKRS